MVFSPTSWERVDERLPPLDALARVVRQLDRSRDNFVFLGGSASSLFITDAAGLSPRPTKDVDALVRCDSYGQYVTTVAAELRRHGFREDDSPGAPTCRWVLTGSGIRVDFMPTNPAALRLLGRWFADAFDHSELRKVDGEDVRVVSAPYFVATKLEAFRDRGGDDYMASHDLEDLIAVIDGRAELLDEVTRSPADVGAYIRSEIGALLDTPDFMEALPGHLGADESSQGRLPVLTGRLVALAGRR